ncbi:MAG: hypothetical protein R2761_12650 [Acidimicrobiales bacterium]
MIDLARRAAVLAIWVAGAGVFAAMALAGLSVLVPVALLGAIAFAVGVWYGLGFLTALGLCAVAVPAAMATPRTVAGYAAVIGMGVAASLALLAADASWWLRRDPQVDPAVARSLIRTYLPVWAVAALLGAGAMALGHEGPSSIWMLPAAIAVAAGLVGAAAAVTRGRHRRHDPLSDIRRG